MAGRAIAASRAPWSSGAFVLFAGSSRNYNRAPVFRVYAASQPAPRRRRNSSRLTAARLENPSCPKYRLAHQPWDIWQSGGEERGEPGLDSILTGAMTGLDPIPRQSLVSTRNGRPSATIPPWAVLDDFRALLGFVSTHRILVTGKLAPELNARTEMKGNGWVIIGSGPGWLDRGSSTARGPLRAGVFEGSAPGAQSPEAARLPLGQLTPRPRCRTFRPARSSIPRRAGGPFRGRAGAQR